MHKAFGDRWFYHPTREVYTPREEITQPFEDVHFRSENLTLHGWFFPSAGAAKATVVHFHGMGGNVTGHFRFVSWLASRGFNVLAFDYRGFGRSEGEPTREGTIADGHAAIDFVKGREDVGSVPIFLLGQSLGASIGIVVASARSDLSGAVFEGAFARYRDEAGFFCRRTWWTWGAAPFAGYFVSDGHDPIDHVAGINSTPKFFIAGGNDSVCSPEDTRSLHDRAHDPKALWIIEDLGHLSALTQTEEEGPRRIEEFFLSCM